MNENLEKIINVVDGKPTLTLSSSSINSFNAEKEGCPLKFRLDYIERVKTFGKSSEYGALGTAFHSCAEIMYMEQKFDRRFLLGIWETAFNDAMSDPKVKQLPQAKKDQLKRQGYPILQTFYSTEKSEGLLRKAEYLEKEFTVPYMEYKGVQINFKGKIDRLIMHDDVMEITDYKTSKMVKYKDKDDLINKTIQLPLYAYAYKHIAKHQNDSQYKDWKVSTEKCFINLFFVRSGEKIPLRIKDKHMDKFKERVDKIIETMFKSDFKPIKPEKNDLRCKYCVHENICPSYGNKLPKFEKKIEGEVDKSKLIKKFSLGRMRPWKKDGQKMWIKDFQIEDAIHIYDTMHVLNASQVGTGKTIVSIAVVEHGHELGEMKKVLFFIPKVLLKQWKKEIFNWTGTKGLVTIVAGGQKKRRKLYGKTLWTLVNFEKAVTDIATINKINWDLIGVDEAQRIQGEKAKSSRVIRNLISKFKLAMTGTPIGSKLNHLFRIMSFVKAGILGPWQVFQKRHIIYDKYTGKPKKFVHLSEIREALGPHFIRRNKRDVWKDLPEESIIDLTVKMSSHQAMLYNENLEELLKMVEEGTHNEDNVVKFVNTPAHAKYIKLRSLLNCTNVIDPDLKKFDSPKFDEMLPMIQDLIENGENVIVFSFFRKVIDRFEIEFRKHFNGDDILRITGAEGSSEVRAQVQIDFNEKKGDRPKILLCTDAAQYGLNLQSCSYMFNVELPESPTVLSQRVGRISRPGQKNAMTIYNFIMEGTIEEKIKKNRYGKAKLSKVIVDQTLKVDSVDFKETSTLNLSALKEILI